uniref:NADH-ubiquinone oxidoreductase chain 1 n=1 Tax=Loxosceles similis TaxID=321804 RepID=A0A4P8VWU2_LOXSM|nr:NADH dehydrogenase subunit 1 [Loxosceles similis]QCS26180.1 NADH dehydrogenase subunit 1 [Loxosceles similis]
MIMLISIMICVAFYTLLERKILSYIQLRKGPNKNSFMGILQPFSDAIKLFNKSNTLILPSNIMLMYMCPTLAMSLALMIITFLPFNLMSHSDNQYNLLSFILVTSMLVYPIIMIGWASNSKFSNLGSIRSVAQMISYEVNLFLILLSIIMIMHSYNINNPLMMSMTWILPGTTIIFLLWSISCLAEVNRSPFDFAEGESELVSGFNIEYMGALFALIFLAEYTGMIILSIMTAVLFSFNSFILMMSFAMLFLWLRGTLPRFRFDLMMKLNWMIMLPLTLINLMPHMNLMSYHF